MRACLNPPMPQTHDFISFYRTALEEFPHLLEVKWCLFFPNFQLQRCGSLLWSWTCLRHYCSHRSVLDTCAAVDLSWTLGRLVTGHFVLSSVCPDSESILLFTKFHVGTCFYNNFTICMDQHTH